jgi:hypothetical protein
MMDSQLAEPRLAFHLLCLDPRQILQKIMENQVEKSDNNLNWLAMQMPWPPQGTLIIEINKGQGGKTFLPHHLVCQTT